MASNLDYRDSQWVAEQLGVDRDTVYRYFRTGVLPATRVGRRWLVSERELAAFLARRDADGSTSMSPTERPRRRPGRQKGRVSSTTKREILNATIRIYGENGYAATTLVDVARIAGVTPATVYHHFGSKDDLLAAAIGEVEERIVAAYEQEIDYDADLPANIGALFRAGVHLVTDDATLAPFVLNMFADFVREPLVSLQPSGGSRSREFTDRLVARTNVVDRVHAVVSNHRVTDVVTILLSGITVYGATHSAKEYKQAAGDLIRLIDGSLFEAPKPARDRTRRARR